MDQSAPRQTGEMCKYIPKLFSAETLILFCSIISQQICD